jgi:hypothetical protein
MPIFNPPGISSVLYQKYPPQNFVTDVFSLRFFHSFSPQDIKNQEHKFVYFKLLYLNTR